MLKWQRQLQSQGADEAQIILNANLESIARVGFVVNIINSEMCVVLHDKVQSAQSNSITENTHINIYIYFQLLFLLIITQTLVVNY